MFDFLLGLSLVGVSMGFLLSLFALFTEKWHKLGISSLYMAVAGWFAGVFYLLKADDTRGLNNLIFTTMLICFVVGIALALKKAVTPSKAAPLHAEKPKGFMRLTDDGELEEVSEIVKEVRRQHTNRR